MNINRINPNGATGPRCIGAFAWVVGLVAELVLHGSARRVMRVPLSFEMMDKDLKHSMFEYYQARVPEYDEVYRGKGPASISESDAYTSEVEVLSDIVKRTCSGNLVDIACGTAFWLPNYAQGMDHITLFDQSPKMLDAARCRAESAGVLDRCTFVCGDVLHPKLGEAPFDFAFIGFLISHFTSQEERLFFQVLESILEPDGRFLILDSVWTDARAKAREKKGAQKRRLNDGRDFQIYKKYFDEQDLFSMQDKHDISLVIEHFGKVFLAVRGTFERG